MDIVKDNGKISKIYNEAGYIEPGYFHVKNYFGSTRVVVDAAGSQVQGTDYYPGGLPTAPFGSTMSAEERLHTGKEFDAFSGLAWYDNAARIYDPLIPRFLQIDPLAEKSPQYSPYAAHANNPLKFTDPDGKIPIAAVYAAKALVGGVVDASVQVSANMAKGNNFIEAVKNIDVTSVGTAMVTSAVATPGMSTAAKTGTIAIIGADAMVDVNMKGEVNTIGGIVGDEKPYMEIAVDFGAPLVSGKAVDLVSTGFTKAVNKDLSAKSASILTKETKQSLTNAKNAVNSTQFQTAANAVSDYATGIAGETLKESLPDKENPDDKQ